MEEDEAIDVGDDDVEVFDEMEEEQPPPPSSVDEGVQCPCGACSDEDCIFCSDKLSTTAACDADDHEHDDGMPKLVHVTMPCGHTFHWCCIAKNLKLTLQCPFRCEPWSKEELKADGLDFTDTILTGDEDGDLDVDPDIPFDPFHDDDDNNGFHDPIHGIDYPCNDPWLWRIENYHWVVEREGGEEDLHFGFGDFDTNPLDECEDCTQRPQNRIDGDPRDSDPDAREADRVCVDCWVELATCRLCGKPAVGHSGGCAECRWGERRLAALFRRPEPHDDDDFEIFDDFINDNICAECGEPVEDDNHVCPRTNNVSDIFRRHGRQEPDGCEQQ